MELGIVGPMGANGECIKREGLICVISCNGQSLLKFCAYLHHPVISTTQPEFSQDAKEQTSPQILAILQGHCAKM